MCVMPKKRFLITYGDIFANLRRHCGPDSKATFIDSGYVKIGTFSRLHIIYWAFTYKQN